MKRVTRYTISTIFSVALSGAAWAQQQDLEVTMDVVPASASASGAPEIKLPIILPDAASARGRESSAFGLETANKAREMQGDLGREFGKDVSEAARARSHAPNLPPQSRRP
jgi:hypothetical protein